MSKTSKFLLLSPALLGATLAISSPALAQAVPGANSSNPQNMFRQINQYSREGAANTSAGQVTSVSQLSDVQPTDWAFQALQSLVERYGCIAGFPDGTYRGNRALTRYEFAAGLNACLGVIQELIRQNLEQGLDRSELEAIERLQQEFAAELATLRGRVNELEVRTAELEGNQFSTTTKLEGESIFALIAADGGNAVNSDADGEFAFGTRTRLDFNTSFTGRDLLFTRLQVVNIPSLTLDNTFTPEGDLQFNAGLDEEGGSTFELDTLFYSTPIGENTELIIIANNGAADDVADTITPLDGDGGSGAISRFGTRAPIYHLVEGTGIGLTHNAGAAEITLAYLADSGSAPSPTTGNGLFNGPYSAMAQVLLKPTEELKLGFTYVNAYNKDMQTGSNFATPVASLGFSAITNAYGFQFSYVSDEVPVKFGGWVGYTNARILDEGLKGDQGILNWAVTLGLDAGPPGSQLGLVVGMEPKVIRSYEGEFLEGAFEDEDTSIHIEGFYEYRLSENIAITPGFVWLTAPDHDSDNDSLVVGTLRTTFTF
ncbi:MAG: iron uptake porin [Oscillatoria sp. SIO1A7]|nr:iron uptake porin [Oscillatoria sp. SIO1A7]